jgi:RNA polymerase primary sigma factor
MREQDDNLDPEFCLEVGKTTLLTAEEERALATRKDLASRNRLVEANLRLVIAVVKKRGYRGYGVPFMDLVQEGCKGLIRAAERYDPACGSRFSTYAYFWIRQAVSKGLATLKRTIRIPQLMDYAVRPGADVGGVNLDCLHAARMADGTLASLSDSAFQVRAEAGDPEAIVSAEDERRDADNLLAGLTAREALVLRLRYGLGVDRPMALHEVGQILGVTREAIRQIQVKAVRKLQLRARIPQPE